MKIAIASEGNLVNEHFGKCKSYSLFTVTGLGVLTGEETFQCEEGCACNSDTVAHLLDKGVNVLIAGSMGAGAYSKLSTKGIRVYRGCSGDIKAIAELYIRGELLDSGSGCGDHAGGNHQCNHAR